MKPLDCETLCEQLHAEFTRLNEVYFGGRLHRPLIVVSRRKTYGGYYQPKLHKIVISYQAFLEHGWPETLNTFRHEVAHIVHPNHSQSFWSLAVSIGSVQRHASAPKAPARIPRYSYVCPGCSRQIARHRKFLKPTSCGACDKTYNPRYALQLITRVYQAGGQG